MQTRSPNRLASVLRSACATTLFSVALAQTSSAGRASPDSLGTLMGHVRCRDDRHAVVIVVRNGGRIASADIGPDGTFFLGGVPAGRHTLLLRGDYCGPVELPVTVRAGGVDSIDVELPCKPIPCPKLDKSDPGCIAPNLEERAKVGSACELHKKSRLRLDVVPLSFGIVSFEPGGPEARKRYPNARVVSSMGCVVGVERWGEVAYCPECRAAFYWHNPQYLLHPIQPLTVERREK